MLKGLLDSELPLDRNSIHFCKADAEQSDQIH